MVEVEEGNTYTFNNVRVVKEYDTKKRALGTSMECTIDDASDFNEPVAQPAELPESFTNTSGTCEILGINSFGQYHCCRNCNRKIPGDSFTHPIVKCTHCNLAQRKDKCITQCFVQAMVELDAKDKVNVTFHEQILQIFSLLSHPESVEEQDVTEALLDCPFLDITFDQKSNIVSKLSFQAH